jgi:hypothetical protein
VKVMSFGEAVRLAAHLNPRNFGAYVGGADMIDAKEMAQYKDICRSNNTLQAFLKTLDRIETDLVTLRRCLITELVTNGREALCHLIIQRHESILSDLRVQPVLDEHPGLAVYMGRNQKRAKPAAPLDTTTLAGVWGSRGNPVQVQGE